MISPVSLARLACALVLASCCSTQRDEVLPVRALLAGEQSGIQEFSINTLRSAEEWRAWWSRHSGSGINMRGPGGLGMDVPPEPDWTSEMIVAVVLSPQPSLGYGVELVSARREEGVPRLVFRTREPAPGTMQGQVITHPFLCVVLPRSDGMVDIVIE